MEKVLVLFSGGADSTLLLKLAEKMNKEVFALMIYYGQLHRGELDIARQYCTLNKIPFKEVTISGLSAQSALTGSGERGKYEGVSEWHVPGRNSMFLSIALSEAESKGITEIWYGPDWSDREHLFPDCYQEYIVRINSLFEIAGVRPVKVYAPTLGMTKEMVLMLLESFGVSKDQLFSGYGVLEDKNEL
jgi:7-cyano-7-deazaguanine synthase